MIRSLKVLIVITLGINQFACGVKGDPLPPEKPSEIGRGQPNYRKAAEEIQIPSLPSTSFDDDEELEGEGREE